jgi:hypothetical protein
MTAKKSKKSKKKETIKLDQVANMMEGFTRFLDDIEGYRKNTQPSKELISNIFTLWADTVSKDPLNKHQEQLVRGFGAFLQ